MAAIRGPLHHRQIYKDATGVGAHVSLGDELSHLGEGAEFVLVEDPRLTDRTLIIGMFVLRPMLTAWSAPIIQDDKPSLSEGEGWCHNVSGLDGGGFIADGCAFDAYRLGLQYVRRLPLCIFVTVWSGTVCQTPLWSALALLLLKEFLTTDSQVTCGSLTAQHRGLT